MPWITEKVILNGPYYPETNIAAIIVLLTTYVALAVVLEGHVKAAYIVNAPLAVFSGTFLYFLILILSFLMPFIPIIINLDSGIILPHQPTHRLLEQPPPDVPPELWLIGSLLYVLAVVAVVITLKQKSRQRE